MADDAANPDPTPAPGLNPAAAASSEDDAPKQMRTCYMCAERFDVTGFAEKHAAKCRKLWLQERGLPEDAVKEAPVDPADAHEELLGGRRRNHAEDNRKLGDEDLRLRLDALSMRVWKQQSLKKCPNCFRTFKLDKFLLHKNGCHAKKGVHWMETAGGQAGRYVSGTGGNLHAYEFPGKKEGTTVPMDPTLDPGWELTAFCFVRRLTSGGQAECGGVRVGDKITAICGTAVITDAEVAVEWAKAEPDPENDGTPQTTNTFTFRQVLQLEATTVVLDLNRDLGMMLTEGGVVKSVHLDKFAEKCQAEIAGITCGRKVDRLGSLFKAPVDGELQVEDITPTAVKDRKQFDAAVAHRQARYKELGLNGPLWCRVRFCSMGKVDPMEPLGVSVCQSSHGDGVVVRAVDEAGQVARDVPSLQVGCRIESLSGCCVSSPDEMRQLLFRLRQEHNKETYINFSPPTHFVPPEKHKVDLKHVSYIDSGPPPLEEKADRGEDTLRYGTFWGDTLKANDTVGKRVLVDPSAVQEGVKRLAAATGDPMAATQPRIKKRSARARQLTNLSQTLLRTTTDGTTPLLELGDPSHRLATVVAYRAKTEMYTVELVGSQKNGKSGQRIEVPPSAVREVGFDKEKSGDLVDSLMSLDIKALRAVAESDPFLRRCHECAKPDEPRKNNRKKNRNGTNRPEESDPELRLLDRSLEAHKRMLARAERIAETLAGVEKRRSVQRDAARVQRAMDAAAAAAHRTGTAGQAAAFFDAGRASHGAGDWDGTAFSPYASAGGGDDPAGDAARRRLAVSAISRKEQWARRNSSQGVSMSWA
jgi:hypothetical protein